MEKCIIVNSQLNLNKSRWERFKCWLIYGHTKAKNNEDVWQCERCGKKLYSNWR